MSKNELIPVETQDKIEKALEFFHSLREVKFTNDEEYERGLELCKSVKSHIKEIDSDRKTLVQPYNDKVKDINGECNGVINKLKNAENVLKNGMGKYFQEKEQKRIAEQKRLNAEAEERRRQEEERARKEREKEDKYRDAGREEMADKAAARAETAETISSSITAPIVENTAKGKGASFKTVYVVEVFDKAKAVEACLTSNVLLPYIDINVKGLERLALTMKGQLSIDGIRIREDRQVSIRR